jgi:hypothetical protein
MNTGRPALYNVGWNEFRKALEPKACGLGFPVAELIWLNDLLGLADAAADDADWIFYADAFNVCQHKGLDKIQGGFLFTLLAPEPAGSAHRQVCAWRVCDHQIKWPECHPGDNITLDMEFAAIFGWEQIATPGVMTKGAKCAADGS